MLLMWGKEETKLMERLRDIEGLLEMLVREGDLVEQLRGQNRELFDRLMARNWDQWAGSPSVASMDFGSESTVRVLSPTQDESRAGEILTDEELK